MSWAVTRSLVSARRTLPSRTVRTCSFSPIVRMFCVAPLKANEDVREATRSEPTALNACTISSVMPSLKYSLSGSALMFRNGSTAIEFAAAGGWTSAAAGSAPVTVVGWISAAMKSPAVGKRSAGRCARAHDRMTGLEQDVLRLDVAMQDVVAVGVVQGIRHLGGDVQRVLERELALAVQAAAQRFPLYVGHHVVQQAVGFPGVVQWQDVWMGEAGGDVDLAQEAIRPQARGQVGAEHLEGD